MAFQSLNIVLTKAQLLKHDLHFHGNPEVPRKFARLSRKFPGLPQKFPGPRERSTPLSGKPDTIWWLTTSSSDFHRVHKSLNVPQG